ncbi:MAG: hypothetical protein IKG03_06335 [Clostridiales bacterium]|nr:hypothetical protein [Clostridiales bacterium]
MRRSKIRYILTASFLITALVILLLVFVAKFPEFYCKRCLNSNISDFDNLVSYVRQYELTGKISVEDGDIPLEVEEILVRLNNKYQSDSDYPVFTGLSAKNDGNGNIYMSVQVRKDKIPSGDGYDSPDIRCYELVYVDPDYGDSIKEISARPFNGNWRIWSSDMWSG